MPEKDVSKKKKVNAILATIIEYVWMCLKYIVLNMLSQYAIEHSPKSLYKVLNTSWDSGVFRILSDY